MAADDDAVCSGIKPSQYANTLVSLAQEMRTARPAPAMALSMAGSTLRQRVEAVLSQSTQRSGVKTMEVFRIAGLSLLGAAAIAFACPSLAQDAAPPDSVSPAAQAEPATPPVPDMPPVPPAPPAPPVDVVTPPVEAVPPPPPAPRASATDRHLHFSQHGLGEAERKQIRTAIEEAQAHARAAMVKAEPEMRRALEKLKLSEEQLHRMQPQIDAALAQVEKERPEIEAAIARAQPEIDKALAQVREELAKEHLDAEIKTNIDEALKRAESRMQEKGARGDSDAEDHSASHDAD